jgi:hypothetical protein
MGESKDMGKDTAHDGGDGSLGYKVMAAVAAMGGAFLARKSLTLAWRTLTGKEPPANPEHPTVTWPEALSWAVVSGAVIGLARLIAQKQVASSWHRATGELPADVNRTAA